MQYTGRLKEMPLSKENQDKIVMSGLYIMKNSPDDNWCKNWTFVPQVLCDQIFMADTYFSDYNSAKKLIDDNFDLFELVMDFNKVRRVEKEVWKQYVPEKRFNYAVDSGGWEYSKYFVLKDAKPLRELARRQIESKISSLELSIVCFKQMLLNIDNDSMYE